MSKNSTSKSYIYREHEVEVVPGKGSSPAPSLWSQVRNSLVEEWQVPGEKNTKKEVSFLWQLGSGSAAPSCGSHFGRANVKQLAHPFAAKAVTANLGAE